MWGLPASESQKYVLVLSIKSTRLTANDAFSIHKPTFNVCSVLRMKSQIENFIKLQNVFWLGWKSSIEETARRFQHKNQKKEKRRDHMGLSWQIIWTKAESQQIVAKRDSTGYNTPFIAQVVYKWFVHSDE